MYNKDLFSIISNNLQNNNNYNSNEIFSMLGILVLISITEIYQSNYTMTKNENKIEKAANDNNNFSNLGNLLGQLQGGNNNGLEQMLPLLLGALGGSNTNSSNLDIGNIISMINKMKPKQNQEQENEYNNSEVDNEDDFIEEDKKKISGEK
ncbi:MAG: hypothetical protein ACOC1O_02030 [bacterium]